MNPHTLNCGYVPLVDCAPLVLAERLRFAQDEGLRLNLLRQPSWAALRDLLALGHLDVAHMLSPMPLAMTLGLSGAKVEVDAMMVLSANGTVMGVSTRLASVMREKGWTGEFSNPLAARGPLLEALDRPLRVGVPFPYSMHRLLFDYWMNGPSPAYEIVTTPPPMMADALGAGDLDVFCVGEPWGSVAVTRGVAELLLPGAAIWAHAPEKVLAARRDWVSEHYGIAGALMRAIHRATAWLDDADNHALATEILSRSEHLDVSETVLDHALSGQLIRREGGSSHRVPHFLRFHDGATNFPWRSQGAWIGARVAALHGLDANQTAKTAEVCMRPDLYRAHLGPAGAKLPGASAKIEGALQSELLVAASHGQMVLGPDAFFDGRTFDFGHGN